MKSLCFGGWAHVVDACHLDVIQGTHGASTHESIAMNTVPTPTRTSKAAEWLESRDASADRLRRTLLTNIDGHRNVIELESFARAIGLEPDALDRLRRQGLIQLSS